jgi:uncharacterized protein (TIGR03435 family)
MSHCDNSFKARMPGVRSIDITAKIEDGAGTLLQLYVSARKGSPGLAYLMLRTLLEDRFKLAMHSEVREMPIYVLVLAKTGGRLGPRLVRSDRLRQGAGRTS